MTVTTHISPPRLWDIFLSWASVGVQSFGGGASTLYLVHRMCITRGWLSEAEFARAWALVRVAPGINLIKLTILIGHQLRGAAGILAAVAGLLLPSASITVLMTAGFTVVREWPLVRTALRGVMPATVGLSLALGVEMARPLLGHAHREGRISFLIHVGILIGATLALAVGQLSPIVVLVLSGALGAWLLRGPSAHIPPASDRTQR